jgi:regulatory protein
LKITDIKQQVKNQSRYSIYVDGKYSFSLSESALLGSKLSVGNELTGVQIDDLKNKSEVDKAYNNCLNLIVRRKRSKWEIEQYLKRKSIDQDVVNDIVKRLEENNWLDDLEFARAWVNNRRLLKPISKRRLWQELKAKRVDESSIKTALSEDLTEERKVLAELVERKQKQTRYQDKQKLMAYLLRQGYSYDDVKSVIED